MKLGQNLRYSPHDVPENPNEPGTNDIVVCLQCERPIPDNEEEWNGMHYDCFRSIWQEQKIDEMRELFLEMAEIF